MQKSRRTPIQQRGRRTVDQILDATESLMATTRLDAISTNLIAEHVGLPIGTIYHYFSNKHEVFYALAERAFEEYVQLLEDASRPVDLKRPLPSYYGRLIDELAIWWVHKKDFMVLWRLIDQPSEMRDASRAHARQIAERMGRWISFHHPSVPRGTVLTMGRIIHLAIASALDTLFFEPPAARKAILRELKAMIVGYLTCSLADVSRKDDPSRTR